MKVDNGGIQNSAGEKKKKKMDIKYDKKTLKEIEWSLTEKSKISRKKMVEYFLCKDSKCHFCTQSTNKNSEKLPCMFNDAVEAEGSVIKFAFLTCVRCKTSIGQGVRDQAVDRFRKLTKITDEADNGAEIRKMVEMSPQQYLAATREIPDPGLQSLIQVLSSLFMGAIMVGSNLNFCPSH